MKALIFLLEETETFANIEDDGSSLAQKVQVCIKFKYVCLAGDSVIVCCCHTREMYIFLFLVVFLQTAGHGLEKQKQEFGIMFIQ